MKSYATVMILLATVTCALAACTSPPLPVPTATPSSATSCGNPREHVYNPDRLFVLEPCVTVRGVIASIRHEPDGDDHVRLIVDVGQKDPRGGDFLNDRNRSAQGGALVLEPVCEHGVTQPDAVSTCAGYHNGLVVPPVGTHVAATGPWVYDVPHGWLEIHPLMRLVLIG